MQVEKYKILKILGDGAFGTVYKSTNTKTGEVVAIKKMKQKYTNWNECIELRQIKSLRKLTHPNLIKLKEVLLVSEELYMVFEYLDYNLYDVYSKMKESNKAFTQREIKNMSFQIVSGLAAMHKQGFFHRDMKPQNLLIYNGIVKICDLGLARQIRSRPPFTDYVSTRWYRAPELLLRSTVYNSPVDIFALGCIMTELYTLCPLFAGSNEMDQLNRIVKILGTPNKSDWPEGYKLAQAKGYYFPQEKGIPLATIMSSASPQAVELLESMLSYSPRKRPTAAQILKHDYFKGITLQALQITQSQPKEIIFQENPSGTKLDTFKEDKNLDQFRATKEKFKMTKKADVLDQSQHKFMENDNKGEDLDSIIRELQQKQKRRQNKLPFISTREKFNKYQQKKQLRESKTQLKHTEAYKLIERDQWKNQNKYHAEQKKYQDFYQKKYEDLSYKKGEEFSKKYVGSGLIPPPSKNQPPSLNKFSYSFQPALLPGQRSSIRPPLSVIPGILSLPKPSFLPKKNDLFSHNYKY